MEAPSLPSRRRSRASWPMRGVSFFLFAGGLALAMGACRSRTSSSSGVSETLSSGESAGTGTGLSTRGFDDASAEDAGAAEPQKQDANDAGNSSDATDGDGGAALPGNTDGCPAGMLRVEGEYC